MSGNSSDVCTNIAYLNSLNQKSRFQIFNIPANRYDNLANSPYQRINPETGQPYTKFDLDMRRKAEILKYSSNRMSTQTNNLTKAQKFAQAINGYYQQRTYSKEYIAANTENGIVNTCPPGSIIKTPSSASDVPGDLLLYEDPTVPIYNLVNDTGTPGIINQLQNPYSNGFKYSFNNDVVYDGNTEDPLFTVYMFNSSTNKYLFSFTSPVLIQFNGSLNSSTLPSVKDNLTFQININSVSVNVNYSYSPVSLNTNNITYRLNNTTIANQTLMDISLNPQTKTFSGSYYLGTITVSNILLPVALGYIYDFKLSLNFNSTFNNTSKYLTYYNSPIITSVLNVKNDIYPNNQNCVITPNTSIVAYPNTPYSTGSVNGTNPS
jgi:hypothetical protein